MKENKLLYLLLTLVCSSLFSCCITDKYDFDKDLSLGLSFVDEGLMLPLESDVDIPMSQLIELNDSSELMIDSLTGNYLFYKVKNDMDTVEVNVKHGSLCNGTMDELNYMLHDNPDVVLTPNSRYPEFASMTFETVVMPSFDPDQLKESIRELVYMDVNLDIVVTMNFNSIVGLNYFTELQYEVPFFFVVADKKELKETNVRAQGLHTHTIHVVGVDFRRTSPYKGETIGIDPATHKLDMHGGVRVRGTAKTVNIEDFYSAKNPQINYRVAVGTLGTLGVTGRFYEQEWVDIDPIEFDNLPDFIKDEEVSLDIENPVIRLALWNQVPTDISLNAELTGMREEKAISKLEIGADYGTPEIAFRGPEFGSEEGVLTHIWVSRRPVEQLPDSVAENVVIPEVMEIVRHMPDAIQMKAYACTDSTKVIKMSLSQNYQAVPAYEMVVPLKIGKDMKIVYNKDFEDLHEKLKHIDLQEINITARAENHLPLDMSMKMVAYDINGKEIQGLQYDLPSLEKPIPGKKGSAAAADATCDFSISIRNAGNENSLQQIDHLQLKVYATSSAELEGQYLNRNQNLQLRNIKVLLK